MLNQVLFSMLNDKLTLEFYFMSGFVLLISLVDYYYFRVRSVKIEGL